MLFRSIVGETNFWYFFQLEDCFLVQNVIQKNKKLNSEFETMISSQTITSTFKIPYYLQKRKWQDIQLRLSESNDPRCKKASVLMNKRMIVIEDKNMNFFKNKEYENWDLIREF